MYEFITSQIDKDFLIELNEDDTEHKVSYFKFLIEIKIRNQLF